ncbi:MAG TPA: glycosyltransferase family 4 protein [Acidimicrobiales bacterium]|nr:glycosyltransferase family 4 protein [Acidimicrobiales bacterium]
MAHVLLTNDFPPKVGGIQSYLWELWRRLPPERVTVITGADPGAAQFDSEQGFRLDRLPERILVPTGGVCTATRTIIDDVRASLLVIDPALPLGLAGRRIGLPYVIVLHGAEAAAPARLPGAKALLRRVLSGAQLTVTAGAYATAEAYRLAGDDLPVCEVPPGVDLTRFRPLAPEERPRARADAGLPPEGRLILAVSRLVPRKGIDVLIRAAARLAPTRPDLNVAVAGAGRDRYRLERLAGSCGVPVWFLGEVPDERLAPLVACADVFAIPCRSRWGGLEQEGFGIVFLEAAACGVPQVAGSTGGAAEAVADGQTGFVVGRPNDPLAVEDALARLLDDADLRQKMGSEARRRAEELFDYDRLAGVLDRALCPLE